MKRQIEYQRMQGDSKKYQVSLEITSSSSTMERDAVAVKVRLPTSTIPPAESEHILQV